jgi:WD domain, G-beta repeat
MWDIEHKKCLHTFSDHSDVVSSLKFHPDGTCLAAVSHDKKMKLWDARSLKIIQHYDASNSKLNALDFHPSGYFIGTVSEDSQVKIWDIRQGRLIFTLFSHTGSCNDIKFSKAGTHFVTGGKDGLVMVWKTNFFSGTESDNLILDHATGSSIGNEKNYEIFSSNKQIIPNTGANCSVLPCEDTYGMLDNFERTSGTATGTFGEGAMSVMMESARIEHGLTRASDLEEEGEDSGDGDVVAEYLSGKIQAIVEQMHHLTAVLQSLEDRLEKTESQTELLISSLSYKNDKSIRVESMIEKRNKSLMMSKSRIINEEEGKGSSKVLSGENPFTSSRSKFEENLNQNDKPIAEVEEEDENSRNKKEGDTSRTFKEEEPRGEPANNAPAAKTAELAEIEALMEQQKVYRNEIMNLRRTFEKFAQSSEEALLESKQEALLASINRPGQKQSQPVVTDFEGDQGNEAFILTDPLQEEEEEERAFTSGLLKENQSGASEGLRESDERGEAEVNVFREYALARSFKDRENDWKRAEEAQGKEF